MGSFGGHVMPGVVFLLCGLRWAYCILLRYFLCRRELALVNGRSRRFQSSLTFPFGCCPGIPIEAAFIFIATITISTIEVSAVYRNGYLEVSQHLVMYSFYGITAATVILKHYRYQIVPDVDYVCLALSLAVDAFLINRHVMGLSTLEVQVHQNHLAVNLVAATASALEIKYRHNVILPLIRAFSFSLLGTWMIQEDFMLWSPWGKWPNEDHEWIMLATISFGAHIAAHLLLMGLINVVALRRAMSLSPAQVSLFLDREGLGQKGEMDRKIAALTSEQSKSLLNNFDDDV